MRNKLARRLAVATSLLFSMPILALASSSIDLQSINSETTTTIGHAAGNIVALVMLGLGALAIGVGLYGGWTHMQEAKNRQQGHNAGMEFTKGFIMSGFPVIFLYALVMWIVNTELYNGQLMNIFSAMISSWNL